MKRPISALASVILVAGCTTSGAATQSGSTSSSAPVSSATDAYAQASSQVLLNQAERTILDQKFSYPKKGDAQVTASIVTIPVGGATGRHWHNTPLVAYVLSGKLQVDYENGPTKELAAGDAIMEAIDTVHNGRNVGNEEVRILAVNLGAEGVVNTEKVP